MSANKVLHFIRGYWRYSRAINLPCHAWVFRKPFDLVCRWTNFVIEVGNREWTRMDVNPARIVFAFIGVHSRFEIRTGRAVCCSRVIRI